MLEKILGALLPAVITVLLGYFAARHHDFKQKEVPTLNRMVMGYALPILLFIGAVSADRSELVKDVVLLIVLAVAFIGMYGAIFLLCRLAFRFSLGESALSAFTAAAPSTGFVGPAVLGHLYGEASGIPIALGSIIIIATIGASGVVIIVAITFASAPGIMRIVRGLVLDLRNRDYVAAAQTRGESAWRIMLVEILPNARGPLIVDACLRLGYVIITIGVLGFLGLGLPPPDPDWGGMINETRSMAMAFPHMVLYPCFAISSLILGFNLLADGLREVSLRD